MVEVAGVQYEYDISQNNYYEAQATEIEKTLNCNNKKMEQTKGVHVTEIKTIK